MTTNTNAASGAADDSLLLCASDLQHSAIYDNHEEMKACMRAVAKRIAALASAAAQPAGEYPPLPEPYHVAYDDIDKEDVKCFAEGQLRAYVDADRAMRAAQPAGAQAAPTTKAAPAAVAGPSDAVAYIDIGEGGYLDLGSDLSDEALRKLPKGRHMLVS